MTTPAKSDITTEHPAAFRVRVVTRLGTVQLREVLVNLVSGAILAAQTLRDEYPDAKLIVHVLTELDAHELNALRLASNRIGCSIVRD